MNCSNSDSRRRLCIVTGTRAEYGLLYWFLRAVHEDPCCELQLLVTGSHLSPEFGLTVREIEADGFPIAERIEILLSSDSETAVATSMGLALIGFGKAYERLRPDVVIVVGDRYEILAAAAAAAPFRIPVAHIHGGESSEGAMDELFRHAVTKMSRLHFPAAEGYARRIRQMGESPDAVHCFGALASDNIRNLSLMDRVSLAAELGLSTEKSWGVLTYHPATMAPRAGCDEVREVLEATKEFPEIFWVMTSPGADAQGRAILRELEAFASECPQKARLFSSLGRLRYLSLLKWAAVMVGNSSSGIIEAPFFDLPVVNIGDRQKGRIRGRNVVDASPCERREISEAIRRARSGQFGEALAKSLNPYAGENVALKILSVLKTVDLHQYGTKHFWDQD